MSIDVPLLPGAELRIPAPFSKLYDLAHNLWWSWDPVANDVWRHLEPRLWAQYRNPIEVLAAVDPATWVSLDDSPGFHDLFRRATSRFESYLQSEDTWWERHHAGELDGPIAYLCAEYGLHTTLPIYSGGLGVLAGDHAKSASDLGLPFVGTGLLYRRGYFRQEIDAVGDQQHTYPQLDLTRLPVRAVAGPTGGQLKVRLDFPGRPVNAAVWCLMVGRVPVLLLDTDIPENDVADRPITHSLYIGGREMRFCQEYVLGLGSVKALRALGIEPSVWHVNEGHAALSLLERVADAVEAGASLEHAERAVKRNSVFTLHTPVPAGNEVFEFGLVEKYLASWPSRVGTDMSHLARLGSSHGQADGRFDLGALAIRLAAEVNGVSERHASVVSRDWEHLLHRPALAVTNGVHPPSWIGLDVGRALGEALGPDWPVDIVDEPELAERILDIPDEVVWEGHMARKELLSRFLRGRIRAQKARQGASPDELRAVQRIAPPDRLTIGFARRFATYKRALLVFHNIPWLQAILTNPERPVQIVFAGKAHPADHHGQDFIRRIVELSETPELRGHIHVVEDYTLRMARFLTQGVDVWLNNPRPPQEASGTSGMKAAQNGGLNLSVLDGWWVEGFNGKNGWKFGADWDTGDHAAQDNEDAVSLYQTLQNEVVPLYYDRGEDGIPGAWVAMMKNAMSSTVGAFSTNRMVRDYVEKAYVPHGT